MAFLLSSSTTVGLEGEQDTQYDPLEAGELAKLLRQHQIPLVLLNACQSGKLSGEMETSLGNRLIQAGVQTVMAMGYTVTVSAAEVLMQALYQGLFERKALPEALCLARQALANRKERRVFFNQRIELEDWMLPILYQDQKVEFALQPFTPQEEATFFEVRAARYRPPQQPSYGFVGRDLDILQIEKRLLLKRNLLLICGMGGAGKTTLLHYLATWWQRTGLVQDVFYFGYDERAWNRQQIMHAIARKLLDKYELLTFQSLSLDAQQARLTQLLKSTRYLLILDNLESITGSRLAVQHTLSRREQEALRLLLADLVSRQTLVLLGSRSAEAWLAKGTFEEQVYELAGLDQEAASQLAERILERNGATSYRSDPDLPRLLKLLDGFPLALEVVLANLAQQKPAEVIAALQEGNTDLQVGTSEERTENILRCVEYSYRNLSSTVQQLLLCLAPFTSVIWLETFNYYIEQLTQQPALTKLPLKQCQEMVQETVKWGLLSPDANVPSFLHIQPILPYFLRRLLIGLEQREQKVAVERAFYEHYKVLSSDLFSLVHSKKAQERQVGLLFSRYEYENVLTALRFAILEHLPIGRLYIALSAYLDHHQDYQRGQELDKLFTVTLETLSVEQMTDTDKDEWIPILGTIANRQLSLKQYEVASSLYQKILNIIGVISVDVHRANAYYHLGMIEREQHQWEQAEQYYQQALEIYRACSDRKGQTITYRGLGIVAQEQHRWEQAEQYYQRAWQIAAEYNNYHAQASIYDQLGRVAQGQRRWEQAEEHFLNALRILSEIGSPEEIGVILGNLARFWLKRKDSGLIEQAASILGVASEKVENLFQEITTALPDQFIETDS